MLTVQIISDLHIEYKSVDCPKVRSFITPSADILVMAGDIGSLYKFEQLHEFIKNVCKLYKAVLYVPGNHEYYEIDNIPAISFNELTQRLESLRKDIPNLYILDRNSVLIDNICFAGCTLWSEPLCSVPRFIVRMNDMTKAQYQKRHTDDLQYLTSMFKYCQEHNYKLVVITHYPPSYKTLNTKRKKKFQSLYASNLDHLLTKENVNTWICGHTHGNFDFISDSGTRVVSNQKGKAQLVAPDYSDKFTITIS